MKVRTLTCVATLALAAAATDLAGGISTNTTNTNTSTNTTNTNTSTNTTKQHQHQQHRRPGEPHRVGTLLLALLPPGRKASAPDHADDPHDACGERQDKYKAAGDPWGQNKSSPTAPA